VPRRRRSSGRPSRSCRLPGALDQQTGKIAWRTQLEDYKDGYSITGATRYFDGLVFTGVSGSEYGIRRRMYVSRQLSGDVSRDYDFAADS
jgi:hypothetical protein